MSLGMLQSLSQWAGKLLPVADVLMNSLSGDQQEWVKQHADYLPMYFKSQVGQENLLKVLADFHDFTVQSKM